MADLVIPFVIHWDGEPQPDLSGIDDPIRVPFRFVPNKLSTFSGIQRVQEFLFSPRFPFFAEPPKGPIPRFMERTPRQSGKHAADDIPSWARGSRRSDGETPSQFAKRIMDGRYGRDNWREADREYKKTRKFGQRAFQQLKPMSPLFTDDEPQA